MDPQDEQQDEQDEIGPDGSILFSTLTCPECGHGEKLEMPPHACQSFHTCSGCGVRLKARDGDCCVFCSYGDVPCPPVQQAAKSCCAWE